MQIEKDSLILAEDQYYSLDTCKTQLNNNVLVVGTSGSGKTRSIVTPNLLQAVGSYIISDPKGNLYQKYKGYLEKRGYTVKCLDFIHPERSDKYNPLAYIRNTQDIVKISNALVRQRKFNGNADPFWDDAGTMLFQSVIAYLMEAVREKDRTLGSVIKMICRAKRFEGTRTTDLERMMAAHKLAHPTSWAWSQFEKVNVAADKTMNSILITMNAKLRNFDSEEVSSLLSEDQIGLTDIGRRKTAVFVVISDTDRSMDNLVNLFFTQAMNELCRYADESCRDSRLPVPVRFILDDFATNCHIEEFPRMISSIRSRGISTMLMIQAESQLTEGYGHDGRTIIGNCDTYVYLGGNDIQTAQAVAERCDLPLRKILYMPVGHNWIFRRGQEPSFNRNFDLDSYQKQKTMHVVFRRENQRERCF